MSKRIAAGGRTAVMVVGPPRSGTSAISGVIEALGFSFGSHERFVDPKIYAYNPIFYELESLNRLNDRIIESFGCIFNDHDCLLAPSDYTDEVFERFFGEIRDLVATEFVGAEAIGLKDTRFCLTAPLWIRALKALGYEVRVVCTARNVLASLDSNSRISGRDFRHSQRIVILGYVAAACNLVNIDKICINFDMLVETPVAEVKRLALYLNSRRSPEAAAKLIRAELNRSADPDLKMTPALAEISAALRDGAAAEAFFLRLGDLIEASGLMSIAEEARELRAAVRQKDERIDKILHDAEALQHHNNNLEAGLRCIVKDKDLHIEKLGADLDARLARILELEGDLRDAVAAKDLHIEKLGADLDVRLARILELESELRNVVAAKDSHIEKLDIEIIKASERFLSLQREFHESIAAKDDHIRKLTAAHAVDAESHRSAAAELKASIESRDAALEKLSLDHQLAKDELQRTIDEFEELKSAVRASLAFKVFGLRNKRTL